MASMFVAGGKVWEKFFTPLSLFANGEQGAWFDPSAIGSMFQDAVGTIPAAYGQPVGLMLDKSKGGPGPELVTNGDFSDGATGWTPNFGGGTGWSIGGGVASYSATVNSNIATSTNIVASGKAYEVRFDIVRGSGVTIAPYLVLQGSPGAATTFAKVGVGSYKALLLAPRDGGLVFRRQGGTDFDIDNISVREIPGNHARQATATARPTLMQSGAVSYLYRDPVDDALPWTAPAGSYDIVHIPLTGPATVLTAQALSGATNILLAENTRAYLAIDRRLTMSEIDALAAYYGASA